MACMLVTTRRQDSFFPAAITLSVRIRFFRTTCILSRLKAAYFLEVQFQLTGNTVNAINVGNGGFAGRGRWSELGLSYRLTQPTTDLPGGHLTIDPGAIVEATESNAALRFRSTRHNVLKGLPNAPIIFRGLNGQLWDGLLFHDKLHDWLPLGVLHDRERAFRRRQHG